MTTEAIENYHRVSAGVIASYRRRWWRWYLQPSWREMALMDADHQGKMAARALRYPPIT